VRIGFASIYSWRPHVEHIYFLALLAGRAGHETFFLTCDGDLSDCYTRELRGRAAALECALCRAGGIRSYSSRHVDSIGRLVAREPAATPPEWAFSSASTLGRFESDADYRRPEFARIAEQLQPSIAVSFAAAREWIERRSLDAVCIFNGRMDSTRAIYEAAKSCGIRVVSVERTWFGDGLQLYPEESCLGLGTVHRMVSEWRDLPLTRAQALRSASHVAARFLRTNVKEWRAYNVDAQTVPWPVTSARRRILLIPSSRNEVWGHPDWEPAWRDPTEAYDRLIDTLRLAPSDLVLRCHPNWAEMIGKADGRFSERHYAEWARARGVHCIPAADKANTLGLIEECDALVVANGSAAMEAGFLGKQVIGIAPSIYQESGLRDEACDEADLQRLELWVDLPEEERVRRGLHTARQALRFLYTMVYRIPQYTRHVRAESTTRFIYDLQADPRRFIELLETGILTADDSTHAVDPADEQVVLDLVCQRRWNELQPPVAEPMIAPGELARRGVYRVVDLIARKKAVGDR
jgi:hypothetical protein